MVRLEELSAAGLEEPHQTLVVVVAPLTHLEMAALVERVTLAAAVVAAADAVLVSHRALVERAAVPE
jgi:hypothetical protein